MSTLWCWPDRWRGRRHQRLCILVPTPPILTSMLAVCSHVVERRKTKHTAGPNSSIRRRFLATEYLMACKTPCETVNKISSYLKLLTNTYTCLFLSCLTLLQLLNHDKLLCRKEPCLAKYM